MPASRSSLRVHPTLRPAAAIALLLALAASPTGCGNDDKGGPTNTGQACSVAAECYPGVKDGDLLGDAECLDKVDGGYCTHHCTRDSDCCAATGECAGDHAEVCSPFESTGGMYCFSSCEKAEVAQAKLDDADLYCRTFVSAAFHCRSTGGGSDNRKVCLP